ncbi:type VII secretion protein EsaA [Neobacillus sp. LXY-1]|uniref:type VII secretion protein EsaA n=1 Tax=Neobacillus sp. LXY-1 TaxID=3379133 RepID=UPI003EE1AAAB
MKKVERSVLLFLIFVLVLMSGSSYLALDQASKSKNNKDEQKMSVALVNEDQGAKFNGKNYEFGNEFIKNIEKDDQHDWYVVSRGVAESGVKRNVYNMMIVIPNDFTQKALSIDSKSPDQVLLNYKINASDNSNLKAKAEKTASSILGEFNRRIIDVYFASVIGNLHDAQDNIASLVKKEQLYTNIYNDSIHRPLAGYTTQFSQVQNDTQQSRDSFKGLQDILKEFEGGLGQGVQNGNLYQSSITDFTKLQSANGLISQNFTKDLGQFNSQMNDSNVQQQLDHLIEANKAINEQFHTKEDQTANILTQSAALQNYLASTKEKVENADTEIADQLASDMQEMTRQKLINEIKNSSGKEQSVYLTHFFAKPDENARQTIQKQIDKLPSLNAGDITGLTLKDQTITQLKNIIALTNKYNREFNYTPKHDSDSIPLVDQVEYLKKSLITDGVTISDSVKLPANVKKEQGFTLSIPENFSVAQVLLTLPHSEEMDYTSSYIGNKKINLPQTEEGNFTVRLKVKLKESGQNIDVFQPITWKWKLDQTDITDADVPDTPEHPKVPEPTPAAEQKPADNGETAATPAESGTDPSTQSTEGSQSTDTTTSSGDSSTETPTSESPSEPAPENPKDEDPIPLIFNNLIIHQVMSPLVTDSTSVLVNAASDTVSDYQKLLSQFDLYFGIGLDQLNRPDLMDQLNQTSLTDMASKDSLYYLFNKQDIVDILANYVAEQITEEVRQQTEELKAKMDNYLQLVNKANDDSTEMAKMINKTMEQAELQNENLSKTLEDVSAWRELSLKLQDTQTKMIENSLNEQTASLSLDTQFKSLLSESQSLADQSKNNLNAADHVYQTFDDIDNLAKDIQASGITLVKQAGDLSDNLTKKAIQDQTFANNFAGVLANSRVGERPNENLINFLSNPVQTQSAGVIMANGDTFTPYFIVLICFIVALFSAYVLANNERKKHSQDSFVEERSLLGQNTAITMLTVSLGLVEGLIIGLLSANLLKISDEKFMTWVGMITLVMTAIVLVAAYLLRQLKMAGMFILLVILSLYLFLTKAIGLQFDQASFAAKLKDYSPLQYIETWLTNFGSGTTTNDQLTIIVLIVVCVTSVIGHLFVVHRFLGSEEVTHEGVSENL